MNSSRAVTFSSVISISIPQQPLPAKLIVDSTHPNFYRQFSETERSEDQRNDALRELETELRPYQIAALELKPDTCPELTKLVINNMYEILCSKAFNYETVSVHLNQSILKLRDNINNETNESAKQIKSNCLKSLNEDIEFAKKFNLFPHTGKN